MDISLERSRHIVEAMAAVRRAVGESATIDGLEEAKRILRKLASRRELFPESEFSWPTASAENRMYCLDRGDDDELALYIDLLDQGAGNAPHGHGNSWAVVVGIEGQERHNLFRRKDEGTGPGHAELEPAGHLVIGPGDAVSLLPQGIHSIAAEGTSRLMMMPLLCAPVSCPGGTTGVRFGRDDVRLWRSRNRHRPRSKPTSGGRPVMMTRGIEAFRQLYEGIGGFAVIDPREELILPEGISCEPSILICRPNRAAQDARDGTG